MRNKFIHKLISVLFVIGEIILRYFVAMFMIITLFIVGGLAIQGGEKLQMLYPNMFDQFGGWWIIHSFINFYMSLIIIIPLMIIIFGRERQIYDQFVNLCKKIRSK